MGETDFEDIGVMDLRRGLTEDREKKKSVRILSDELGRQRGWLRSRRFSLEQLCRGTNRIGGDFLLNAPTVFYRERKPPFRPAAIAVHLSGWPECGPDVEAVCERFNLRYEGVVDFPAWIDGAHLVVITRETNEAPAEGTRKKAGRRKKGRCEKRQLLLPF